VAYFCHSVYFYKDFTATQLSSQQRRCDIFVDKYITKFIKQRSCDILICQNFIRPLMILFYKKHKQNYALLIVKSEESDKIIFMLTRLQPVPQWVSKKAKTIITATLKLTLLSFTMTQY
jgi:hypothetical protein